MMKRSCSFLGIVTFVATTSVHAQCELQKVSPADGFPGDNFGYSVSTWGDYAIVGVPYDDDIANRTGCAYMLERVDGIWGEVAKLYASDAEEDDRYGWTVDVEDGIAVVGSRYDQQEGYGTGAAYVYERIAGTWTETAKLTADDAQPNVLFGDSVAVSGDYIVVGGHLDNQMGFSAGAAYVFERQPGGNWTQAAKLTASDGSFDDRFGFDVNLDGERAVIGAYGDDPVGDQSGSAYVFERVAGVWTETFKLVPSDSHADLRFGADVAISGDTLVVGALFDDHAGTASGSAYVFDRQPDATWVETQKLTASDAEGNDYFGDSVSIDGSHIVIGAWSADSGALTEGGAAYTFANEGGTWVEEAIFVSDDVEEGDNFGFSVAASGRTAIVASRYDDLFGSNSGSVYFYTLGESGWIGGDAMSISLSLGGSQELDLVSCPTRSNDVYFVLGSLSGTVPGLPVGFLTIPLNLDGYFLLTLNEPNFYPLTNTLGILDGDGRGQAAFTLNPGAPPEFGGITLNHAFVVLDAVTLSVVQSSVPVPLDLLP